MVRVHLKALSGKDCFSCSIIVFQLRRAPVPDTESIKLKCSPTRTLVTCRNQELVPTLRVKRKRYY